MKFHIVINQIVLAETKLDIIDGAILDYLYHFCSSPSDRVEKYRINGYTWINFKHLLAEMPMLRITAKSRISERIRKIEKEGFITANRHKNKLYIKMTADVDKVFFKTNGLGKAFGDMDFDVPQDERFPRLTIPQNEHKQDINYQNIKTNVNVDFKDNDLTDTEKGKLYYLLERIKDQKNYTAWQHVVKQLGLKKVESILLEVSESKDAKSMGACAMGLAKKEGFKKFYRPNK